MSSQISRRVNSAIEADASSAARLSAEDRRQQLIEIAIRLFSQKGFRGTTTKEIAAASGVTEAMIFRHFKSKDDLYAAILDYKAREANVTQWIEELNEVASRREDEALFRKVAEKMFEHHRRDRDFLRLMLYSALEGHELARRFRINQTRPLQDFLSNYVETRQREGAFRHCDPDAAVRAYIGSLIHHILITKLFASDFDKLTDKDAIDNFSRLFLDGLRSIPPASRRAKKY